MRMYRMLAGFSLIELMIVVAVVGILAVTAMPRYQDYSTRARIAEAVHLLSAARVSVAEYAIASGEMPATLAAAGLGEVASEVVESIGYERKNGEGVLTVKLRNTGSDEADGRFFSMVGQNARDLQLGVATTTGGHARSNARGVISWRCQPGDAQGRQSVPPRFLPSSCRGSGAVTSVG